MRRPFTKRPEDNTSPVESLSEKDLDLGSYAEKNLGGFGILCTGFNICNSWAGLAATLAVGIAQGGTVTLLYGQILIFVLIGLGSTATLAELTSVYPTAGGQYHWTSILAPKSTNRALSYFCGAANIFGWLSICTGVVIQPGQFISAMVVFFNPDFEPQAWHIFLIYQAVNILILLYNIYLMKRTSWIHDVGFVVSLSLFIIITITCATRAPGHNSSTFVWTNFVNDSGWSSDGIVFLTGLANPNFMYAGIDGAIHLAEECSNAVTTVPLALFSTSLIGFVTAFAFSISMVYSLVDLDAIINTPTGVPIYEIWYQATRSSTAATVFLAGLLAVSLFALNGCVQTASRLTWSYARDNALLGSSYIGQLHPRHNVPVWALVANSAVIFIIGCIYLGSDTAFHAFVGTGLLLQQISFAVPAALLLYHRRSTKYLAKKRRVRLGLMGWIANALTVGFAFITLVFYCFPTEVPVTGSSMNYTVVVIGCMALFSLLNWVVHARRVYQGPRLPEGM
ncbi:amino acid transporter [Aspergillus campestris IBT 28561]|uniref:Amino acid transporter n=1 Tax=Aspergillus campestris (strain IBT 28561) TaxID=1392248 RepID=A0A2I1CSM2_ASPC2|nr:amino acid transporter [Aspergillus campestris IBT 28561]PKY00619.1 amino acid transporter [Aspergillus campestris IBT 28561]